MKRDNVSIMLLCIGIAGFLLLSVSFVLMPWEAAGVVPGILFWGGLLTGAACQIALACRLGKRSGSAKQHSKGPRIGLLTFGSNQYAVIADNTFVISAIAAAVALFVTDGFGVICFAAIALAVFSFCMHCILNGKTFHCLVAQENARKKSEQKQVNHSQKERKANEE